MSDLFSQLYSKKLLRYVRHPQNMGMIKNPDGEATVGNPVCLPPQSLIYTNKYMQQIGILKGGTKILSHDGRYHKIKRLYKRNYKGRMHHLRVHNLGGVSVTPEHHILAIKSRSYSHKFESIKKMQILADWFPAKELKKGDVLLYPLIKEERNLNSIKFNVVVPKWDFKSKLLPKEILVSEEFLRLGGYYLAEGYVRTNRSQGTLGFCFGAKEENYISEVALLVNKIFNIQPTKIYRKNNSIYILFYSARLARFFEKLFGKGAINKHLPHWMITLSSNKQASVLCGLWRGDGYINSKTAKYVTISLELAYQIKLLLLKQKIIFSFLEVPASGIHKISYCFYVKNDDSLSKLAGILGTKINLIPRIKAPKKSWFDDNFYYTVLREVKTYYYKGFVYNLEVENTHSFISSSAALHNCGDIMKYYIKVEKKRGEEYIKDIKFQTLGCGAAIASSSILTTMVKGKKLSAAEKLSKMAIIKALGGLPPAKIHCSVLAEECLKSAIRNYKSKKSKRNQ